MGGSNSRLTFRTAVLDLVNNPQSVTTQDEAFWERYWQASLSPYDYFTLITAQDVRDLKERASGNLTALCFKIVERICNVAATACSGQNEQVVVLNCCRLLTRILPFLFESSDWRLLFWSPANFAESHNGEQPQALAQVLLNALADLLFCPDFTVIPKTKQGPEVADDLSSLDSCEYIWESGIGCAVSPGTTKQMDSNRTEILKLLMTCFSEPLYSPPTELHAPNRWLAHFTSPENRHILPLLTSLVNVACKYDPVGYGVPYYYAMVRDPRGELVETATHMLSLLLDYNHPLERAHHATPTMPSVGGALQPHPSQEPGMANLFCGYVSRLHQNEDLEFIAKGLTGLLCNPLKQTYLPRSIKKIYFSQELYILIWKLFELNKKFLLHMLRSPCLFDLIVPLIHQLLETRTNPALVGMLHVGVFILLVLSGERNFGVRLNKPYTPRVYVAELPKFTGTHADLLFLVFHKIITSGLPRLQPLYDCLLTVMVNVSPYLKTLSMVTCARLVHLMESFSTPWFLFAKPTNHYLVFYLLEIFNNIIQYQFDGNTNMVYSLIRSKAVFYQLANLSEDSYQLTKTPGSAVSAESAAAALEAGGNSLLQGMPPTARWPAGPSSSPSPDQATHTLETVAEVEHSPSSPSPPPPHTHLPSHEHPREEGQSDISSIVPPRDSQTPIPIPDIDLPDGVQTVKVEVKAPTGSEPTTPLEGPPSEPQEPHPLAEQQEPHLPLEQQEPHLSSEQQEPRPPVEQQEPHLSSEQQEPHPSSVPQEPREEEREATPPPKPKPQQGDTPSYRDSDQSTADAQSDSRTLDLGPEPQALHETHPPPLPPPHFTSSPPSLPSRGRGIGVTFDPRLSGPLSHESREAPQKTVAKGRLGKGGLSMTDLFPMNQDVGHRTKQLAEPSTPEFKPTPDWVRSWKQKLPLNTILRVLQVLVPQVEKLCTDQNVKTEHEILKYLKNGTLVGLLPVPHPILIRKYQTSQSTELWFHTYIWGVVYVRNFDPPIWYDTEVQLFQVNKQV